MELTVQIPDELGNAIAKLPDPNQFITDILSNALKDQSTFDAWKDVETEKAIAAHKRGVFATPQEVEMTFTRLESLIKERIRKHED
ncbi:MAG: hypothetical protein HQL54_01915 [Magnetococcales bacterium]|nr:hypothetical protein [Magnetococcales bacterium]